MTTISALELYHMPIATAEFGNDPLPHFAKARESHDWLAASDIGFVLTGYRAIDDIMRLDDKLTMPGEEIVDIMGAHPDDYGLTRQSLLFGIRFGTVPRAQNFTCGWVVN